MGFGDFLGNLAGFASGAKSTYESGEQQKAMAEYNAKIVENEALAKQQAIESEARQMGKAQRGLKAKQRVSVGMRGGLQEGTDLLALAEQSKNMQLDQLELQRMQDIARIRGTGSAQMYRWQGSEALKAAKTRAMQQMIQFGASAGRGAGGGGGGA